MHEEPECFGIVTDAAGEHLVIVTEDSVIKRDLATGKITEKEKRRHEKYYPSNGKIYGKSGSCLYGTGQEIRIQGAENESKHAGDRISITEQHVYVYRTGKVPKEERREKENLKMLEVERYSRTGEEQVLFRVQVPHEFYICGSTLYTYNRGVMYTRNLDIGIDTNGRKKNDCNPQDPIMYDLDVAIGVSEGRSEGSPSQPKRLVEIPGPPTAICETQNYVVMGFRTGAIVFVRKVNRETTHTLWHSTPVVHLVHLDHDTVISASKKGKVLLTDGASVSNTFLFSLRQQIKEMHVSENGYLCVVTPIFLQVYDIPARSLEHTLFFFSRVTQSLPISPAKQRSTPEYFPDLRTPRMEVFAQCRVQNTPEKLQDGEMHVLGNLLVFTDEKDQVYWTHKELAQIRRAFYSDGHILLCVSESEEKIAALESDVPVKAPQSVLIDLDTIYKLYSVTDASISGSDGSCIVLISSTPLFGTKAEDIHSFSVDGCSSCSVRTGMDDSGALRERSYTYQMQTYPCSEIIIRSPNIPEA